MTMPFGQATRGMEQQLPRPTHEEEPKKRKKKEKPDKILQALGKVPREDGDDKTLKKK